MKNIIIHLSLCFLIVPFCFGQNSPEVKKSPKQEDKTQNNPCNSSKKGFKTITFNQDGQWKDGFVSALAKGETLRFLVLDDRTELEKMLDTKARLEKFKKLKGKFDSLSKANPIYIRLFKDSVQFDKYIESFETNYKSSHPKYNTTDKKLDEAFNLSKLYRVELTLYDSEKGCKIDKTLELTNPTNCTDDCGNTRIIFQKEIPIDQEYEKIEFKLITEDFDNQIIAKLLKDNIRNYYDFGIYKQKIDSLTKILKNAFGTVDKIMVNDSLKQILKADCNPITLSEEAKNRICNLLETTVSTQNELEKYLCYILEKNKEWLKAWLWYNEGNPLINPFIIEKPSGNIEAISQNIALITKQITLLESYVHSSHEDFDKLKLKIKELHESLAQEQKNKNTLEKNQTDYTNLISSLSNSSNILYHGVLFGSHPKNIQWMHHYDASKEYKLSNSKKSLPEWVSEIDDVTVLTNNLAKKTKINLTNTISKAELVTPLEESLNTFASDFDNAKSMAGKVNELSDVLKLSLFSKTLFLDNTESIKEKINPNKCGFQESKLEGLKILIAQSNWLLAQTKPIREIKLKANMDTLLFSKYASPNELLSENKTFKLNYELKVEGKTEAVAKGSYKKNELIRFWPAGGIAFLSKDRFVSVYEDGQFKEVAGEIGSAEPIVGVKYYPFKMNVVARKRTTKLSRLQDGEWYSYHRGNSIINRISVFGGVSATKRIFKNYYFGLGIDPVPGFNLQFGYNVYFQKSYQLKNGEVISSSEKIAKNLPFYFAFTFDQGIITKLLKLF